jgi:hypothetical protein
MQETRSGHMINYLLDYEEMERMAAIFSLFFEKQRE